MCAAKKVDTAAHRAPARTRTALALRQTYSYSPRESMFAIKDFIRRAGMHPTLFVLRDSAPDCSIAPAMPRTDKSRASASPGLAGRRRGMRLMNARVSATPPKLSVRDLKQELIAIEMRPTYL